MKKSLIFVLMIVAMLVAACAPAATEAPVAEAPAAEAPAAEAPVAEAPAEAAVPEVCGTDAYGCAVIPAGSTIKIGYAGPMTGDYSQFGIDMSQAMKIAIADFPEVEGFKTELVVEDDLASAEGAAAVANKLVTDPTYVAMAGHAFSGATNAAMPIYEKAGIPMLSPSATNPDLTKSGSKVFNRNTFSDAAQTDGAAAFLFTTLGKKNLAILHDGTDYGQALAQGVQAAFEALGGTVVSSDAITPGEADYSAALANVASKSPDALYFGGYVGEGAVLANQMKQSGLENVTLFSGDGIFGLDFISKAGANAEGVYSSSLPTLVETDAVKKFNEAYLAAYGAEAGKLSAYTWTSYDAAAALISVIKSVAVLSGDTLYIPRGALIAGVRGLKDYAGIAGVITCQENGECVGSKPVFNIVKDGAWVIAE